MCIKQALYANIHVVGSYTGPNTDPLKKKDTVYKYLNNVWIAVFSPSPK
jgi:hypothetical protein